MKPFKLLVTTAVLLLSLPSIAQKNNIQSDHRQFKRLYIGDTVPMESIVFNNVRNYPGGKAKLSDFKGKYIIIDFWTKGCTACIAAFPHMEELQNQFKEDIQVLLVTKNSEEELALLSKNSMNLKNTRLPVVIGDQILATQLFPHESVPFHVWLDKAGKVVATTYAQETNTKNLKDLIARKSLNLLIKNEILDTDLLNEVKDQRISLLKINNGSFQLYLKYYAQIPTLKKGNVLPGVPVSIPSLSNYSMFMNYIPGEMMDGYSGLTNFLDKNGTPKGYRICNMGVDYLYQNAFIDSGVNVIKIIAEGRAKLLYEDVTDSTNLKRHLVNNSYCYESCLQEYTSENSKKLLQQDLTRFFGMKGVVEDRMLMHLILTKLETPKGKKIWMRDQKMPRDSYKMGFELEHGFALKNVGFEGLVSLLKVSNRAIEDPVIIDETGYTMGQYQRKVVDILLKCNSFHATKKNTSLIRKALLPYGLGLQEEMRNAKVLVLKAVL
ncbi:Thiol-disulfide oxidoreductase ResA [compost metagenome]